MPWYRCELVPHKCIGTVRYPDLPSMGSKSIFYRRLFGKFNTHVILAVNRTYEFDKGGESPGSIRTTMPTRLRVTACRITQQQPRHAFQSTTPKPCHASTTCAASCRSRRLYEKLSFRHR